MHGLMPPLPSTSYWRIAYLRMGLNLLFNYSVGNNRTIRCNGDRLYLTNFKDQIYCRSIWSRRQAPNIRKYVLQNNGQRTMLDYCLRHLELESVC
jgi:hypothetical protein